MILETTAYAPPHMGWVIGAGFCLALAAIGFVSLFATDNTAFGGVLTVLGFIGLFTVAITAGVVQSTETEKTLKQDLSEMGFSHVELVEGEDNEFIASKDGEYLTCAILDEEKGDTTYTVVCDGADE